MKDKLFSYENRYCKQEKYDEGFVCFLDILGFGEFIKDETNFPKVKQMFNEMMNHVINYKLNDFRSKISIASDSVLISISKENGEIHTMIDSILDTIVYFRMKVVKYIGTDIRASITYGSYVHAGLNEQIYYGPAILKAVMLAEKSDIFTNNSTDELKNRPACIIIDKDIFKMNCNLNYELDIINWNHNKFHKLKSGYILVNPYFYEYNMFNFMFDTKDSLMSFINDSEEHILKNLNSDYKNKYEYCELFFDKFKEHILN